MEHTSLGEDVAPDQLIARVSWEDYLRLEAPEGLRFEFDEGRLLVSPTGIPSHNLLIAVLLEVLGSYEEKTGGRHAVAFPPQSYFMPPGERDYQPDVSVITDKRKDRPLPARLVGAPDIAVEILSPSTARRDRGLKAARYFEEGTREYWMFDAEARTAEFYRRGKKGWVSVGLDAKGRYGTPLLPGFKLDMQELWRRLDRKLRRK